MLNSDAQNTEQVERNGSTSDVSGGAVDGSPAAAAGSGGRAGPDDLLGGRDFSGVAARVVIDLVEHRLGSAGVARLLGAAGEARSVEQLTDSGAWSSYAQFRRLLAAAAEALGGVERLREVTIRAMRPTESTAGADQALRSLGSPDGVYASAVEANRMLLSITTGEMVQAGDGVWVMTRRLNAGFEPFPELCAFLDGVLSLPPTLFGMSAAVVVEEECQCAGAPSCRVRVRWDAAAAEVAPVEDLAREYEWLQARLQVLQRTVGELVSGGDLEEVLARIVASAARSVPAPGYVLAIEELPSTTRHVYAEGMDEASAATVAGEILAGDRRDDSTYLIVEVASTRRRYGWLAALNSPGSGFMASQRAMLETYAGLAAAALDSATALAEARGQAATAHALLQLAESLAEVATVDEVAARIARAVPLVIDCDHAAIVLSDPASGTARIAGLYGFDPAATARLEAERFEVLTAATDGGTLSWHDPTDPRHTALFAEMGVAMAVTAPISASGEIVGWISVSVANGPERLGRSATLAERLRGLAAQAASALTNARLLDQVRHQALHDALTGLPNRTLILDRAERMLARARRSGHPVAALFVDLDNFKAINDSLGHAAGDELLKAVAARIGATMRDSDTVGRLGGDEFVVLSDAVSMAAGPELIAERICHVLREPFELASMDGGRLTVSASVGVAVGDRPSAGHLLRDADIALYRAKAAGRDCYAVFEANMQSEVLSRLELEMQLRDARAAQQFFLVYQPILDLDQLTVTGFEALLRWQHPTRGIVSPDEFIPILEENGMIIEVGRWVLDEACSTAVTWQRRGQPLSVSVNVSMRQLDSASLVADVQHALAQSGLHPENLIVEITETALMRDVEVALQRVAQLKAIGVGIAIDDFGTGYSSLAYLRQFSVNTIKIDRSFIATMNDSAEAAALTTALVKLGQTLGLKTVAEGIEQAEELSALQAQLCDGGQGFLFSKPIDAGLIGAYLDAHDRQERPDRESSTSEASKLKSPVVPEQRSYSPEPGLHSQFASGGLPPNPSGNSRG